MRISASSTNPSMIAEAFLQHLPSWVIDERVKAAKGASKGSGELLDRPIEPGGAKSEAAVEFSLSVLNQAPEQPVNPPVFRRRRLRLML